jgi:hypothetical protein
MPMRVAPLPNREGCVNDLDTLTPLEALGELHAIYATSADVDLAEVMRHVERLFRET